MPWRCRFPGGNSGQQFELPLFARWKDECKPGAFVSTGALRGDCSLVGFHQRLADSQTQTESAELCAAALFKSIEDFRQ